MSKSKNLLFVLSGSIACYKSCQAISTLVQQGWNIRTAASRDALRFVGEATLEGLSGSPVFDDLFESGRMMDHIGLARWADIAVLAPASANTLNQLSAGISSDVIGALFLSFELKTKPFLIFPAMNQQMWNHPATRQSVLRLRDFGASIHPGEPGLLACGESGPGRLMESELIVREINRVFDFEKKEIYENTRDLRPDT